MLSHQLQKKLRGKRKCAVCEMTGPLLTEVLGLVGDWGHSWSVLCITWKQIHCSGRVAHSICNAFKMFNTCLFIHQDNTYWALCMLFCVFFLCQVQICLQCRFLFKKCYKALCISQCAVAVACAGIPHTLYNKFVMSKLTKTQGHLQACHSIKSRTLCRICVAGSLLRWCDPLPNSLKCGKGLGFFDQVQCETCRVGEQAQA